jgi:small subunit ribosomal protein S9
MAKTKETTKTEIKEVKTAPASSAAKKTPVAKKETEAVAAAAVETAETVAMAVPETEEADVIDAVTGKRKSDRYYEAVGRRKTAIARVRLYTKGDKVFLVNNKPFDKYFSGPEFKNVIEAPLVKMNCTDRFRITSIVSGGGVIAQAEALRHGITRALVLFNADFKKRLKKSGYLTRDPRMKERKKPGLKKARRAPQWAKR